MNYFIETFTKKKNWCILKQYHSEDVHNMHYLLFMLHQHLDQLIRINYKCKLKLAEYILCLGEHVFT